MNKEVIEHLKCLKNEMTYFESIETKDKDVEMLDQAIKALEEREFIVKELSKVKAEIGLIHEGRGFISVMIAGDIIDRLLDRLNGKGTTT